ncbi:MAG TPA: A24 family peptidase [Bryobacteraceae bacterium]|nr:A24 family peptidase [Bryobacteraceae bacterium]
MHAVEWMAIVLGTVAVVDDLRRCTISNWATAAGVAAGLMWHGWMAGTTGVMLALLGTIVGFGVFLVFYLAGGMGGGDLKLMAAFGALLGPRLILAASVLAAIAGGLIALTVLVCRRQTRSIPYAPAIVLGSWLALWGQR